MEFADPSSAWCQCAYLFFLLAALFNDILMLRFCLVMANVLLIVASCLGMPIWGELSTHCFVLDSFLWASICGLVHLVAVVQLLHHERPIEFENERDEMLWRFLHRRCGVSRLMFAEIRRGGHWERRRRGDVISALQDPMECKALHLLVEGRVEFLTNRMDKPQMLYSGDLFDLGLCNVFGVQLGFGEWEFASTADSDVTMFVWPLAELNEMATTGSAVLQAFWRNLILYSIAAEFNRRTSSSASVIGRGSFGQVEDPAWLKGALSVDFAPINTLEEKQIIRGREWSISNLCSTLFNTLGPMYPPGFRHSAQPMTGILFKNRGALLAGLKLPSPANTSEGIPKSIFVDPLSGNQFQRPSQTDLPLLPGSSELAQVPSSPTIAKWFSGIPYADEPVSPMLVDQKVRSGQTKDGYLQLGTELTEEEHVQLVHGRSRAEYLYGATEEPDVPYNHSDDLRE